MNRPTWGGLLGTAFDLEPGWQQPCAKHSQGFPPQGNLKGASIVSVTYLVRGGGAEPVVLSGAAHHAHRALGVLCPGVLPPRVLASNVLAPACGPRHAHPPRGPARGAPVRRRSPPVRRPLPGRPRASSRASRRGPLWHEVQLEAPLYSPLLVLGPVPADPGRNTTVSVNEIRPS